MWRSFWCYQASATAFAMISAAQGAECVKADGPASMTFYQYSAQKKEMGQPCRMGQRVSTVFPASLQTGRLDCDM